MHSLPKPTIDFEELFQKCIGNGQTIIQKNLKNKFNLIDSAAKNYESRAGVQKLYKVTPLTSDELEPVKRDDLIKLYHNKLSKIGTQCRSFYDEILAGSKKYLCCFCSYGEPTELDHFLPKSNYPEFSVLPINLIPICHYCNRRKLNEAPKLAIECYVHPYFEEYSDLQWLVADLQFIKNVPTITFQINSELKEKKSNLYKRLVHQFDKLDLNTRYSTRANSEIAEMYYRLNELHNSGGTKAVNEYLEGEAHYQRNINKNSWNSALYYCLYSNQKFCELSWNK